MMKVWATAMVLAAACPAAAQAQDIPGWMAGCWEMREEGGRWAEECWTIPRGDHMVGSGRAGTGDAVGSVEFMRIERAAEGGLVFSAAPGGTGWTPFASDEDEGQAVTFVNPDNEYPQRVRYWREGGQLKARISLLDGSEAVEWSFAPMGGG